MTALYICIMKNTRIVVAILLILVAPTVLYLLLTKGEHNFFTPPYYGPKKAVQVVDGKKIKTDTLYYTIPSFNLTDQNGQPFTNNSVAGTIHIATFLSTTGPAEDKRMISILQDVRERIIIDHRIKGRDFKIVTYSTTPETDSVPILNAFANRLNVNDSIWSFVTGPKSAIDSLGKYGYLLDTLAKVKPGEDAYKAHKFVLVDKEGHIRGVCNGSILMEVNKMVEDIKTLYAWYARPKKGQKNIPAIEQHRN